MPDSEFWDAMKADRKKSKDRKRNAMHNIAKKMRIEHRLIFPNEGTCLLDGRVYYYAQKRTARVKGTKEYIDIGGFQNFVNVYARSR